jgi:hypothetical protein
MFLARWSNDIMLLNGKRHGWAINLMDSCKMIQYIWADYNSHPTSSAFKTRYKIFLVSLEIRTTIKIVKSETRELN